MSYLEGNSLLQEIEKSLQKEEQLNDIINLNKARKRIENFDS